MIFYFSSTGNSKYVAERLAAALHDSTQSIVGFEPDVTLAAGEVLGFVTPTNWFEVSILFRDFFSRLTLHATGDHYTFLVATYGTSPGFSGEDGRRLLAARGIHLDAAFSVRQPDNWTPMFDVSNTAKVNACNEKAEASIDRLIQRVTRREKGNFQQRRAPYFVKPITDMLIRHDSQTKFFHVEDTCIGCGQCAKRCPTKTIEMKNDRPVWTKQRCAVCLGCLHHCPQFAIQYRQATKKHGQYRNPHTTI